MPGLGQATLPQIKEKIRVIERCAQTKIAIEADDESPPSRVAAEKMPAF